MYFSKNFTINAEERYLIMHQDGTAFGNISEWLLLKDSCKDIYLKISFR